MASSELDHLFLWHQKDSFSSAPFCVFSVTWSLCSHWLSFGSKIMSEYMGLIQDIRVHLLSKVPLSEPKSFQQRLGHMLLPKIASQGE